MQVAIIAPKKVREFNYLTKFHLVVPDQLGVMSGEINYWANLSESGHYIILDNGAFERGKSIDAHELSSLAAEIQAKELVLPDVFQDRVATYAVVEDYIEKMPAYTRNLKAVMIVPQGKDSIEWLTSLKELNNLWEKAQKKHDYKIPDAVWGVPKWLGREDPTLRARVIQASERAWDKFHLLGLNHLDEVYLCNNVKNVRSVDTSAPIKQAYQSSNIEEPIAWKMDDYFDISELNAMQLGIAARNVIKLISTAGGLSALQ